MELNKIIQHDVTKPFPLPDQCIDLVFTSPPYWGLRDYGVKSIFDGNPNCKHIFSEYNAKLVHENRQNLDGGTIGNDKFREKLHGFGNAKAGFCSKCGAWQGQLGLEPHPQMYIDHLVMICREIKRVLKKSGSFYLNLGDTYGTHTSKRSGQFGKEIKEGFDDIFIQKRTKIGFSDDFIMEKNLLMIPSRVATSLQDDGWILRNVIIWYKPNPMPSSAKDRLNNTYEPVFHFVKNNNPLFHYNIKTGKSVDKKPSKLKEGIDWGWKDCQQCKGTGWVLEDIGALTKESDEYIEQEGGEKCNKCKGSGKIKISYWKSLVYHYDLDAIREPYTFNRWGGRYKKNAENVKIKPGDKRAGGQGSLNRMNYDCYPHSGKNPGDVRTIPTRSFKGAHFAVFPEELLMKPLKSSCPTQICKKCGKPRERIIETNSPSKEYADNDGLVDANKIQKTSNPQSVKSLHRNTSPDGKTKGVYYSGETIGWTDCGCNAGFDAGVVLDPFCGRGTVGKVAKSLGLHYILFDAKPEYCELARLYIGGQKHKMIKDQKKLGI